MRVTSTKRVEGKFTTYHHIALEFTGAEALALTHGASSDTNPKYTRDSVTDATIESIINAIKAMVGA